jgi:tRNA (guanine-N7-)-methyltransferase
MRGIRQHVNPLGERYVSPRATAIEVPANLPHGCAVEVELGCAEGKFAFALARSRPDCFVVGLDIREKMVARCRDRARREQLANLTFHYVNLNVDLDRVFSPGTVDRFHLLFPDPWFKRRHQKRRVLDDALCRVLIQQLRPGGELHVASDVFELGLEAMATLEDVEGLRNACGPWTFARQAPVPVSSRREDTTRARGQRVWRVRYEACAGGASSSRAGR